MFKHVEVDQNSPEWYELRRGKITASRFPDVMANYGKPFNKGAQDYARKKALEIVSGKLDEFEGFTSWQTERGHELEPLALRAYEDQEVVEIRPGGFYYGPLFEGFDLDLPLIGSSPDGHIGNNGRGIVEVKAAIPKIHFERMDRGTVDKIYKDQIQGNLMITGAEYCDFISYCPEFIEGKQLYILRVERDENHINNLKSRLNKFLYLVKDKITLIT